MMRLALPAFLLAATLLATRTLAQETGATPPAASIADLAWIAGEWSGEGLGSVLHENYSAPAGGQIAGHFYAAKDGKPAFYEFELITQVGDSLEFWVKHFNPDMVGWEDKDKFVRFPLVAVEKDAWHFEGLTIRRTGPDTADHILRIKAKDGTERETILRYRRVK